MTADALFRCFRNRSTVRPDEPDEDGTERYAIVAGGLRLNAMQALVEDKVSDADYPVPCLAMLNPLQLSHVPIHSWETGRAWEILSQTVRNIPGNPVRNNQKSNRGRWRHRRADLRSDRSDRP